MVVKVNPVAIAVKQIVEYAICAVVDDYPVCVAIDGVVAERIII